MSSTELHTLFTKSLETVRAMGKHFKTSMFIAPRCLFMLPDLQLHVYAVCSVDDGVNWVSRLVPINDQCSDFVIVSLNQELA